MNMNVDIFRRLSDLICLVVDDKGINHFYDMADLNVLNRAWDKAGRIHGEECHFLL